MVNKTTLQEDLADPLADVDQARITQGGLSKRYTLAMLRTFMSTRRLMIADATYYVRTDGNNANIGVANTPTGAWRDIQYAMSYVSERLDLGGIFIAKIIVADGTYTEALIGTGLTGNGRIAQGMSIVQGNAANHSAVVVQPAAGNCFTAVQTITGWTLKDLKLVAPTTKTAVQADYMSSVFLDGVVLGGGNIDVQATNNTAFIEFINNPYSVSGTRNVHAAPVNGGLVLWQAAATCAFIGTPVCNVTWIEVSGGGIADCSAANIFAGLTASGTGKKFGINYGGVLRTFSDPDPNTVMPSGLTVGTMNFWPIQAGPTFTNARDTLKSVLKIAGRTSVGDVTTTLTVANIPWVQATAALTANRTWTMPLSTEVPDGTLFTVTDAGVLGGAFTLTLTRQGSDILVGVGVAANSITLNTIYQATTWKNLGGVGWYLMSKT